MEVSIPWTGEFINTLRYQASVVSMGRDPWVSGGFVNSPYFFPGLYHL
jgi:hypothetical protein